MLSSTKSNNWFKNKSKWIAEAQFALINQMGIYLKVKVAWYITFSVTT